MSMTEVVVRLLRVLRSYTVCSSSRPYFGNSSSISRRMVVWPKMPSPNFSPVYGMSSIRYQLLLVTPLPAGVYSPPPPTQEFVLQEGEAGSRHGGGRFIGAT